MALLGLSMSLWISLSCLLTTWPRLSLSWWQNCTPLLWLSLAFPGCEATNLTIDWSVLSLTFKTSLNQHYHHWLWPGHAQQLPYAMRILFPISLLLSILFLNFVLLQDLQSWTRWSWSQNWCLLSSWGHSHQTLLPLLDLYLGTDKDSSHPNSCTCGSCCHLGFLHWTHSHWLWWGPTPAVIFPLLWKIMLITISF